MKKITVQASYLHYESEKDLPAADRELLSLAKEALKYSYSPYSNFKVGAAALLENGEMSGGSNYENAAYPLCICAEQSLLASVAFRFPGVAVKAMAITVKNLTSVISQPAAPCGACRQVICETELRNKQEIRLILQGETGPVFVFEKGRDLLPLAFDNSFL